MYFEFRQEFAKNHNEMFAKWLVIDDLKIFSFAGSGGGDVYLSKKNL